MLDTNCYILKHRESRAAAVIDPGGDLLTIKNALFEADASLRLILLTHGHIDHILALDDLRTSQHHRVHPRIRRAHACGKGCVLLHDTV